jgi:hypothetical protein
VAPVTVVGLVVMCGGLSADPHGDVKSYVRAMRDLSKALGIILGFVGIIWILQGLDFQFAPQSFMTGDPIWVVLGAVGVLAGGALLWRGSRRK